MRYEANIKKRVRYIRIYEIAKRIGPKENFLTRLFVKALSRKKEE